MLELKQMEITDYEDIKQAVRQSMTKAVVSFVEIGFYLKKIKSEQLYLKDGYKDIWEAAESEFGLKRKQAWSFMNINDKYSVDGNSSVLLPQYEGFSKSTLTEMLTLPETDYELITKETKVEDIRELKQAEAEQEKEKEEEQVPGQTSIMDMMPDAVPEADKKPAMPELTVEDAIKRLFRPKEMRVLLNNLCSLQRDFESYELEYWVESLNPSGSRMDKVMPYFIFFYKYADGVKIKNIVTQEIITYTYRAFADLVRKLYGSIGCMADYWKKEYGQLEAVELKKNAASEETEEPKNKDVVTQKEENKEKVNEKPATLKENAALEDLNEDKETTNEVEAVKEPDQQDNTNPTDTLSRSEEGTSAAETSDEVPEREVLSGEVEETGEAVDNPVGDIAPKFEYKTTKEVMKRVKSLIQVPSYKRYEISDSEYGDIQEHGKRYIWSQDTQLCTGDLIIFECARQPIIRVMILNYTYVPQKNGGMIYGFEIMDEMEKEND